MPALATQWRTHLPSSVISYAHATTRKRHFPSLPRPNLPHSRLPQTPQYAAAGRFSLTLKLLGSGVRPVLDSLFSGLAAAVAAAAGHAAGEDHNEHSPADRGQAPAQERGQAPGVMCSAEQLSSLRATYGLPP